MMVLLLLSSVTYALTEDDANLRMAERYTIEEEIEEWIEVNLRISYYTDLQCENTPNKETVDAQGNKLEYGTLAVPRDIPLGSRFIIDDYETEFVARDRGSKKHIKWIDDNTMKVDMFIPRKRNESDSEYFKRVNQMGVTKTKGMYLIVEEESE